MFKVGDKGKTRDGHEYLILNTCAGHKHCVNGRYVIQNIRASIDGDDDDYYFSDDGTFNEREEGGLDLMPPESSESDNIEMPEYPADDKYEFSEIAQLAAQVARDNPDMFVQIMPGSDVIIICAIGD